MEMKIINNCLEPQPNAHLEDLQSASPVDLVPSTHILDIDDVDSSKDSERLINSSTTIEETPKRKWEDLPHELEIILFLSMAIVSVQLIWTSMIKLDNYSNELLIDSIALSEIHIVRSGVVCLLQFMLASFVGSVVINYSFYVWEITTQKKELRYLFYFIGFSLFVTFNTFLVLPLVYHVDYFSSLWMLSLCLACFMVSILVYCKLRASYFFPQPYTNFIKIVPWKVIGLIGVIVIGCVLSYSGLAHENRNIKLGDIKLEADKISKTKLGLSLARYSQ
ncbi:hypothetical protein NECID01_2088 [Nematocida sp. AWRm77]|nr:hypothetical protein NECID01_2088 [Nematocida sp. AWRm77]